MRIVAVIVTYNRLEKLRRTVERSLAMGFASVVVVDNASTDATWAYLSSLADPKLDAYRLPENIGGSGGYHDAMRRAMDRHAPDWLLLYDDDSWPEEDCLERFAAARAQLAPDIGAVSCAVLLPDGRICDINRQMRNPFRTPGTTLAWLSGRFRKEVSDSQLTSDAPASPVDLGTFVGFLVRAEAVRAAGYPRAELFIIGDDYLYSQALQDAGWRLELRPDLRFRHDVTATAEGVRLFLPEWKMYFFARNCIEVWRRTCGVFAWPIIAIRAAQWWFAGARHPDPALHRRMLRMGLGDGLRRDFTRPPKTLFSLVAAKRAKSPSACAS